MFTFRTVRLIRAFGLRNFTVLRYCKSVLHVFISAPSLIKFTASFEGFSTQHWIVNGYFCFLLTWQSNSANFLLFYLFQMLLLLGTNRNHDPSFYKESTLHFCIFLMDRNCFIIKSFILV